MSYSLGEIDALALKAARGVGYAWGQAEDIGRAVRWLCARRLPGLETLVFLLEKKERGLADEHCPIFQGIALCDGLMGTNRPPRQIGPVECPLFILPFAAWSAKIFKWQFEVSGLLNDIQFLPDGRIFCAEPISEPFDLSQKSLLTLSMDISKKGAELPVATRAEPELGPMAILHKFAGRTYAPSTEESRIGGAGAGLSDND